MYEGYKALEVRKLDKVLVIRFNNPKRKNCLNPECYAEIGRALRSAAVDDSITIVVFTGAGEFFTSGNDLNPSKAADDMESHLKMTSRSFNEMVSSAIDCPKLLIAVVNGPAIGIGVTLAALCDIIWCSKSAYFLTPFTRLGLTLEACSSYMIPMIMGHSKAAEMLLLSEKVSAEEAYHFNLVSRIFDQSELDSVMWPKIKEVSNLPPNALMNSKQLIKRNHKELLYSALRAESETLDKSLRSEEFMNALIQFATRKNKL